METLWPATSCLVTCRTLYKGWQPSFVALSFQQPKLEREKLERENEEGKKEDKFSDFGRLGFLMIF